MAPLHVLLGLSSRIRVFRSVFLSRWAFPVITCPQELHSALLGPKSVRCLKCCQMPSQGRPELISSLKYK